MESLSFLRISRIHIFTVFWVFVSITGLILDYIKNGISFVVQQVIAAYDLALWVVTYPLVWVVLQILELIRLDITLSPLWSYVFALLMLKIGLDFRIDFLLRRYLYSFFELALGLTLSSVLSVVGGILYSSAEVWLLVCCVTALVLYEFFRAFVAATLYREFEASYRKRVMYRFRHFVLPQALSGMAAILVYFLLILVNLDGAGTFALVAYIFFVGLLSVVDAAVIAMKQPWGTILKEFGRLKRREFGLAILYGYGLVLIQLLF